MKPQGDPNPAPPAPPAPPGPSASRSTGPVAPPTSQRPRHRNGPSLQLRPALTDDTPADEVREAPFPIDPLRPDVRPGVRTLNRDLSWLQFNARVLHQAMDDRLPILERARFLAIFTSNLDEFVMKRVGWLKRAIDSKVEHVDDGLATEPLLAAVRAQFEALEGEQARVFENEIRPALATEGIHLLNYADLTDDERARIDVWFRRNVFPVLTPLAVDPGHKFPFISNLSQNLGVSLKEPGKDGLLFARVKVPQGQGMPQWVRVPQLDGAVKPDPGRGRFVELYQIIRHNLDELFPGMKIVDVVPFRVTRAADAGKEDEAGDAENLLSFVETQLKSRRFARVVRLEVAKGASPPLVRHIVDMFGIKPEDTDPSLGLLDFRTLNEIAELPRPELRHPVWTPVAPPRLADADRSVFSVIRDGDLLVHHPYESFEASAQRFIAEAAADPDVLAIKQTIYRTSRDSPFVQHLIRAAESGKQVACLVELRARFDESRNVRLAQTLERAGVHVAYGVVGLKTHCKAALVVRRERDGLRSYAHLGTGNYNPATAKVYTDLGLFTCDQALTEDVADLFNLLTGCSLKKNYNKLLVAPATAKRGFCDLIEREAEIAREHRAGRSPVGGRIIAKMNALEDPHVTRDLYRASQAGVRIHLFIRGFCCLRPGVRGLSENIEVTSVVGQFLEHSRVFHFGAGKPDPLDGEWYIGSADWMYRNLEQRVEAICPVSSRDARSRLWRMIEVMSADQRNRWDLRPDGGYTLRSAGVHAEPDSPAAMGTFATLMRDALAAERE